EMLAMAAARIASGEISAALILGGEARWTAGRLKRAQLNPAWITDLGDGDVESVSTYPDEMGAEARIFNGTPPAYALMEDALRHSLGRTVSEHRDHIAELWERFSAVAVDNPWAWDRVAHSATEIREPSPTNRMIAFPYTKAMVANNTVDMASALLLCSTELAAQFGVDRDALVFPNVVTKSHETWQVASRQHLDRLPAVKAAGDRAMTLAGISIEDLTHIDLYACFPSIVQMTARELGIDITRQLTITGGLGFAAAAIGNAVGHSMAAMVPLVRNGGIGFIHGNGGLANTHTFGIYSASPPEQFTFENAQHLVSTERCEALPDDYAGRVDIDAATVVYDREGPTHAIVGVGIDHRRRWIVSTETELMDAVCDEGIAGAQGHLTSEGKLVLP
ncbi:MAG: hypothetical protein AB7N61_26565, partial [Acidimicrobiia bacterium]